MGNMAKQKKKRNKKYHGSDAKDSAPVVVRVSAEERSRRKEWWLENKTKLKVSVTVLAILLLISLLVTGLVGIING